ncbi:MULTISPECIES: sensor histidine kinase [Streptomyces]|uniref:histidine kinase n=1 Tax=Streptomyces venezuelae (strain ATCC 10712 / CBS 650.69 / DSM 40230 / JCM 4526 / NBRC 13096 / PD 04745) TaxID=953739 RepID=F2RDT8_STRVP|nr:ATP-binding protein [Streptomyces venezuelae]APE20570.1 PAS domain-containing sensor histidine kinase [Streptomyces venezuelae]QER97961.1 PAS domain-containing sensor histidine kinase [Streptomyces venezuelae ATCC 10712]QES05159.1 PAS domain-containing sensor histidine kinase [Streptomyces venezuelae]CCA54478.1 Osmosensitive K+ channel histidine kinase KdpD [Streptomyces venezuelae ATCC 10712]
MTVGTGRPAQARSAAPRAAEPPPAPGTEEPGAPEPGSPEPGAADPAGFAGIHPDDLPDGLVVADATGRVVTFNAAASRITAVPGAKALGLPLDQALPLEDLKGRRWWALTDPYGGLATRRGQPERNLLLPGGREVLVSARYVREHPTGPVRRVVVCLRGTEARRRTERSHAELIATVAHELRSPLTSVKGFTATLLGKWERFNDEQKRLMLETVDADAGRIKRLIAELLDISRIDSGRLEVRRQPVDIAAAIGRHVQVHTTGGQSPDRFFVRIRPELPPLWADPDKIDQILGNLLENAVRHGEGTVTIEVAPAKTGDDGEEGTEVTVSDEGPGIPEESMSRVFTRFWRGSKRGGTGLGLYIVKGVVEAHGGTITVGRGPRGGAEFRFILPVGTPAHLL